MGPMRWAPLTLVALACRGDRPAQGPASGNGSAAPTVAVTDVAPVTGPGDAGAADGPGDGATAGGGPLVITAAGVGPLDAATRPDPAALRALVPGFEVLAEHHDSKDSHERPAYDSLWLSEAGQRVAELVVESGAVHQIAIDSASRFATAAGIAVGASGAALAAAYPDLGCAFAFRHRRAGAIADARVLACRTAALPRVSFELSETGLKDRKPIRAAAIAGQTVESIVWQAPDRILALPRASRTISATGVGPLTATTPATIAGVRAALPDFEVVAATREYGEGFTDETIDVMSGGEIALRVVHEDGRLTEILVQDDGFATASGVAVGSTVRELAGDERGVRCESAMPYDDTWQLWCTALSQPNLQFVVDDEGIRREGEISVRAIARRLITEIVWQPRR